jgi:anti-sigma factor RsiW
MEHLREEELVALALDEGSSEARTSSCLHLECCPECRTALRDLIRAVALLEAEPTEPVPPHAWTRLRSQLEDARRTRDWTDASWIPITLAHAGGAVLMLVAAILLGTWLESTTLWLSIRTWPLARAAGGWGVAAAVFFGGGTFVTLALTPVLWWESRSTRSAD